MKQAPPLRGTGALDVEPNGARWRRSRLDAPCAGPTGRKLLQHMDRQRQIRLIEQDCGLRCLGAIRLRRAAPVDENVGVNTPHGARAPHRG